jgi:hypothetical protein
MTRFLILAFFGVAAIGIASAGTVYRGVASATGHSGIVAGEVNFDGTIRRGDGFSVQRPHIGVYEITFSPRFFPSGCAALTVTDVGSAYYNPIPQVSPGPCDRSFTVYMEYPGVNKTVDQAFAFIAREIE